MGDKSDPFHNRAFQAIYLATGRDTCGNWQEIQSRTGHLTLAAMEADGWQIWELLDLPRTPTSRRKQLTA